jgi:hypothetical protein
MQSTFVAYHSTGINLQIQVQVPYISGYPSTGIGTLQ